MPLRAASPSNGIDVVGSSGVFNAARNLDVVFVGFDILIVTGVPLSGCSGSC